jgi:magnesium chelatase family protein
MPCKRATRLCPCGYAGDPSGRCACTPDAIRRYRARISGPLLDRIDLQVEVPRVPLAELGAEGVAGESSAIVRARVVVARDRQVERAGKPNAALNNREVQRDCALAASDRNLLERSLDRLGLSARAYHRILRVARTIADLSGADRIGTPHLTEAIQYRRFARATT